jgi:hypothetical protein
MLKLLAPFLLLLVHPTAHAAQVPLAIGGTTIQFPVDAQYVRLSEGEPKLFAFTAAALPPGNRLVEAFDTRADVARLEQGGIAKDVYFQVQVLRSLESSQVSTEEWNALKPSLTAGMTKLDVNKVISSDTASNDRMSAVSGQQVNVNYGKIGALVVYRETPSSINFGTLMPLEMNIDGKVQKMTIAAAGSFVFVRGKLIYVYAFSTSTSAAAIANLHARLNVAVDQTLALNR